MTAPVTLPRDLDFQPYRRSQIAHLRPYIEGEALSDRVSISAADREAGSPKVGDMIARNPANHDDQWLIAADYFAANFEALTDAPSERREPTREDVAAFATAFVTEQSEGEWGDDLIHRDAEKLTTAILALFRGEDRP